LRQFSFYPSVDGIGWIVTVGISLCRSHSSQNFSALIDSADRMNVKLALFDSIDESGRSIRLRKFDRGMSTPCSPVKTLIRHRS